MGTRQIKEVSAHSLQHKPYNANTSEKSQKTLQTEIKGAIIQHKSGQNMSASDLPTHRPPSIPSQVTKVLKPKQYEIIPLDEETGGVTVEIRGGVHHILVEIQVVEKGEEVPGSNIPVKISYGGSTTDTQTDESGILSDTFEFQVPGDTIMVKIPGNVKFLRKKVGKNLLARDWDALEEEMGVLKEQVETEREAHAAVLEGEQEIIQKLEEVNAELQARLNVFSQNKIEAPPPEAKKEPSPAEIRETSSMEALKSQYPGEVPPEVQAMLRLTHEYFEGSWVQYKYRAIYGARLKDLLLEKTAEANNHLEQCSKLVESIREWAQRLEAIVERYKEISAPSFGPGGRGILSGKEDAWKVEVRDARATLIAYSSITHFGFQGAEDDKEEKNILISIPEAHDLKFAIKAKESIEKLRNASDSLKGHVHHYKEQVKVFQTQYLSGKIPHDANNIWENFPEFYQFFTYQTLPSHLHSCINISHLATVFSASNVIFTTSIRSSIQALKRRVIGEMKEEIGMTDISTSLGIIDPAVRFQTLKSHWNSFIQRLQNELPFSLPYQRQYAEEIEEVETYFSGESL